MKNCGFLLATSYLLNLFDLVATLFLSAQFGVEIEGNPFGALLLSNPYLCAIYKIVVIGALFILVYAFRAHKTAVFGSYLIFTVYLLLGVYHTYILTVVM